MRGGCHTCPKAPYVRWGITVHKSDYIVALAGNPNTGKSTVFNALTGLRQHTGNWPGKTVTRAEGGYSYLGKRYKLIDLPGTYSLLSMSQDEEIARDFLVFGQPDVTIMVADANRLQRNLNLILQVLQILPKVVVCLNLIDEAQDHGLKIDERRLSQDLGVPVVPTVANKGQGISQLLQVTHAVATGELHTSPRVIHFKHNGVNSMIGKLEMQLKRAFPNLPNAKWVAVRLLDGDERIMEAVRQRALAGIDVETTDPPAQRLVHAKQARR